MIERIRQKYFAVLEAYRSADRKTRTRWHVLFFLVALAVLFTPILSRIALVFWLLSNFVYFVVAVGWGVFHLRIVSQAYATTLRWSAAMAFTFCLWLSTTDQIISASGEQIPYSLFLIVVIITYPFLLGMFWIVCMMGASLGAYAYRFRPERQTTATHYGVSAQWILGLLVVSYVAVAPGGGDVMAGWGDLSLSPMGNVRFFLLNLLVWGYSAFSIGLVSLIFRVQNVPYPLTKRWGRKISRFCVRRFHIRGHEKKIDLRGGLIGAFAASVVFFAGANRALEPLQTGLLASMLHLTDRLHNSTSGIHIRSGNHEIGNEKSKFSESVIVLEMDRSLRRDALTTSDECEIQAKMIRRLTQYGVRRIVLPLPSIDPKNLPADNDATMPVPLASDLARAVKHVSILREAMVKADNVVVAKPLLRTAKREGSDHYDFTLLQKQIIASGRESAPLAQETFGATRLPCLIVGKTDSHTIATLLYAALQNRPDDEKVYPIEERATIAGTDFPLAAHDRILADFGTDDLQKRVTHLSYSDVLSGDRLLLREQEPIKPQKSKSGKLNSNPENKPETIPVWRTADLYFKDKVVFLDGLIRDSQETFMGPMSSIEAVAHTTEALLNQRILITLPRNLLTLLLFAVCIFGGFRTFGRNPVEAGLQLLTPILPFVALSFLFLLGDEHWIDVVPISLGAILTYLLIVQTAYNSERDERERNRALLKRFVAPQVIEQYLDEPELLGLGGIKQQVCVIFVDVRNFTGFAETHDPQEVIEAINDYMGGLTEALRAANGVLDKYTGDGLMAFFPLNDGATGSVSHALETAIEMQRAALRISIRRTAQGKQALNLGIGVHYGEAVTGLVGSNELSNYTAMGMTVVVSARLQSIAGGGEVVMSESVHLAASHCIPHDALVELGEPIKVKGVTGLIAPYRLSFPQS